jgi:hypothetical protein
MWNRPAGRPEPPITAVENFLEPLWPKDIDMPLDLNPSRLPYARDWPRAFEHTVFEPLQESKFANTRTVGQDELVAFFGSMGWIGALLEDEAQRLLDAVRSRLVHRESRLPFETDVHWTRLADTRG